ncbi:hypothetical protein C2G38_2124812, partial [Gigaspora rosea]
MLVPIICTISQVFFSFLAPVNFSSTYSLSLLGFWLTISCISGIKKILISLIASFSCSLSSVIRK